MRMRSFETGKERRTRVELARQRIEQINPVRHVQLQRTPQEWDALMHEARKNSDKIKYLKEETQ